VRATQGTCGGRLGATIAALRAQGEQGTGRRGPGGGTAGVTVAGSARAIGANRLTGHREMYRSWTCFLAQRHRSIIPATTHSPTGKPGSTIGAGRLNCCVRNGNRWNPPAVVTGMRLRWRRMHVEGASGFQGGHAPGRTGRHRELCGRRGTRVGDEEAACRGRPARRKPGNRSQAARSLSTGQLSALPRVHLPPINQVVFLGP
jgi:hypothetical protein